MGLQVVFDMSRWRKGYFCVSCYEQLSWTQKMSNLGCCPKCGHTSIGTVVNTVERSSEVTTAWTIFKLKCVSAILRPLIKTHVWFVLRAQNKIDDDTINEGTANQNKANKEE